MAKLSVLRKEIVTLEQSPIGREYARSVIKKFREMPGTVYFEEDTKSIRITHSGTYNIDVEVDAFLEEAGFEM